MYGFDASMEFILLVGVVVPVIEHRDINNENHSVDDLFIAVSYRMYLRSDEGDT